jgi:hypothetical protein
MQELISAHNLGERERGRLRGEEESIRIRRENKGIDRRRKIRRFIEDV